MTDLEKSAYLDIHICEHVPYYHVLNGDSTAKILSVNALRKTFEYTGTGSDNAKTMRFEDVVEFSFRSKGVPPNLFR